MIMVSPSCAKGPHVECLRWHRSYLCQCPCHEREPYCITPLPPKEEP